MVGNLKEIIGGGLYYSGAPQFYSKFIRGKSACIRTLVYHQVTNDSWSSEEHFPVPGVISLPKFESQIKYLKERFKFVSLDQFIDFIEGRNIRANSVLLTFDDGYRNIYKYAFPILKHYRVPAVIFCTGNTLKGGSLWCDQLLNAVLSTRLPSAEIDGELFRFRDMRERLTVYEVLIRELWRDNLKQRRERLEKIMNRLKVNIEENSTMYLKEDEIREMEEFGIEFGSHTMNHPLLGAIEDTKELEWEVRESIRVLEEITGRKCLSFAYPFGSENSYTDACIRVLKDAGIRAAFTTIRGGNKRGCNPHLLHRFIVRGNSKYFFRLQLSGLLDG